MLACVSIVHFDCKARMSEAPATNSATGIPDPKSLPLHIFRPVDYVRTFFKNGVRLDGRSLEIARPIIVNYDVLKGSYVVSSSNVYMGTTQVMCAISVMVGSPSVYKPKSGDVECVVSMNHLQLGNPNLPNKEGSKPAIATKIEHMVSALFNRGSVLDLEQLCILEGRFAYRLAIHLTVFADAGNIKDAAILAAVTAMSKASIPEAVVSGSDVTIDMEKRKPLVSRLVIPVTVGMLDDYCFIDPLTKEENVMDGCITSVLDAETFSVQYSSLNTVGVSRNKLDEVLSLSQRHAVACKIVLSK